MLLTEEYKASGILRSSKMRAIPFNPASASWALPALFVQIAFFQVLEGARKSQNGDERSSPLEVILLERMDCISQNADICNSLLLPNIFSDILYLHTCLNIYMLITHFLQFYIMYLYTCNTCYQSTGWSLLSQLDGSEEMPFKRSFVAVLSLGIWQQSLEVAGRWDNSISAIPPPD